MTKIGNFFFILVSLFITIETAFAEVQVEARLSPNPVALGDNAVLNITISSEYELNAEEPRLPSLEGLDLLDSSSSSGVSQSLVSTPQGMQFKTTRRREFNFYVSPKVLGKIKIDPIEVSVNGGTYRTQALELEVLKEAASGTARGQRQDPFEDLLAEEDALFRQLLQGRANALRQAMPQIPEDSSLANPAFRSLPRNPKEAFFVQVEVDKTEVYEGEQVTANWYVYTRGQMETLDRLKFPSLRGFWKEIIEEVPTIQFVEEIVNGVPYRKALLASHALFPIKAGTAVIDEFKIKSRVRTLNTGFGGGSNKAYEYTKSSDVVKIKVNPLPLEGREPEFTGAVGLFEVNAAIEGQARHPVNEPFTLKLRFEGSGNAKTIDLPPLNLPTGVELFETKSDSRFFKNGKSFKQFDVLIIPRQMGTLNLPSIKVNMFDPSTGRYYTKETNPLSLEIIENPNAQATGGSRLALKDAESAQKELMLPQLALESQGNRWAVPMITWWVLYLITGVGFLIRLSQTLEIFKTKTTLTAAYRKRLKSSQKLLQKGDHRLYGSAMMNLFYFVLGQVSDEGASLSLQKLLEMIPPSARKEIGKDVQESFEFFQTLAFAPEEMTSSLLEASRLKHENTRAQKLLEKLIKASSQAK